MTPVGGTLRARLDTRDNAVGFVRLALAGLVILGHAFPLGGFEPVRWGPFVHGGLHGAAVEGFFVLSGYLVLASGVRSGPAPFLWRRFLRIYPAYVAAVISTAFVFAPLGAALESGARWNAASAASYVFGSLDLKPSQDGIRDTLLSVPWSGVWNGSLWTLFYEACAYAGVALVCAIPAVRARLRSVVTISTPLLTVAYVALPEGAITSAVPGSAGSIADTGLRLWTCFAWGMLAYVWGSRIRLTRAVGISAASVFLLAVHLSGMPPWVGHLVALPSLTVTVLAAACLLTTRIGSSTDLSYGVYLFGFPVQQLLVIMGIHELGWAPAVFGCLAVTLPIAWASWHFIEQPALRPRGVVPAAKIVRAA